MNIQGSTEDTSKGRLNQFKMISHFSAEIRAYAINVHVVIMYIRIKEDNKIVILLNMICDA